jgi:UDP-N-acetylglucosamine acyltransferase
MIHSTAIVHPKARLDSTVQVGPYVVIDGGVELGAHCVVEPYVYLTGLTTIGTGNRFHASCVIGDAPQDLKYKNEPTRLRIGEDNVFREHLTVHRSTQPDSETVIGSHNFFMAGAHVGHNCVVGNHVIMANGALLGGYVEVQDHAFISGNCLVHQFTRVGRLSMMQGGSAISKDLPPFTIALRWNEMCGLNSVGLRRAGFTVEQRLELKRLYHFLFRSGKNLSQALGEAREKFTGDKSKILLDFMAGAKRGVCADVGRASANDGEH